MERSFSLLVVVTVVLTVGSLGLGLQPSGLLRAVRTGRILVLTLAANVLVVPALAWTVATALPMSPQQTTGVVLVAVGAGGSLGLKAVQLSKRGDPALALALVVLLEVADVVAVPAWLRAIAPAAVADAGSPLASVALMVLVPLAVGVLVARRAPRLAARGTRVLALAGTVALGAAITTGVLAYASELAHEAGSWVIPTAALIGLGAIGVGAVARRTARAPDDTVAMVTASRFSSLGLVVVDRAFAGETAVRGPAVVTALVLLVVSLTYALALRTRRRAAGPLLQPDGASGLWSRASR